MSKKFLSDVLIECGLQVSGTTTLGTATASTVATSDNSTNIATTAWVKSLGYSTTDSFISDVTFNGTSLSFTGINSAFTGSLDLSALQTRLTDIETVYATVRNVSGAPILKGTPLAVVIGQTSGNLSDVIPADASDPALMPALFVADEDIAEEAEGRAVAYGEITGIDTSLYPSGTTVYVAPGGGWTDTKPTGTDLIQNLGVITKQHDSNGGGIVTGVGRSNDVPNIPTGYAWVGNANGVATPTLLGSLAFSSATYDNYVSWNLKTNNVQRTTVASGGTLDIVAGSNVSVAYSAGGVVTISSSESDTLDTVTSRDGVTTNTIGVGTINVIGTTAGQELLTVDGTNGRLFTVTDDLSDSLFSVNTIAGLPVIEVFADNTIKLGNFANPVEIDSSANIVIPGTITASGYNDSNWNTAYNDRITSAAVSGTTTKTLTLTQGDGGTVTTSWTDLDRDETLTELSVGGNILSYRDENGEVTEIDLSLYIDDTNLARLISGSLDAETGIATFTRDDSTTFTVDFSSLSGTSTDTLADVTARGATTSTLTTFSGNVNLEKSSGNNILHITSAAGGTPVLYMTGPSRGWGQFVNGTDLWFKDETGNVVTMVLEAGGNVGIGTTAPTSKLDVNGVIKYGNNGASVGALSYDTSGLVTLEASSANTSIAIMPSGTGSVGIGTLSPSTKLYVDGGESTFNRGNSDGAIARFRGKNNEKAVIGTLDSWFSSNVGIGTTSPEAKLDVVGNTRLGSGTMHVSTDQTFGTSFTYSFRDAVGILNPNGSSAAAATSVMSIGAMSNSTSLITTGIVGIGTDSPDRGLTISGSNGYAALNIYKANTTNQIVFLGTGSGGPDDDAILQLFDEETEKVRVFSAGNSWFNGGNIGIGNASPNAKLDIISTASGSEGLRVDGESGGFAFVVKAGSDYTSHIRAGATIGANYFIAPPSNGLIVEGNVGIGTTAPGAKLDVQGNGRFYSAIGANDDVRTGIAHYDTTAQAANVGGQLVLGYIYHDNGSETEGAIIKMYKLNSTSGDYSSGLKFQVRESGVALSTKMTLNPSGNLGIGTTSPNSKLHVSNGFIRVDASANAQGVEIYGRSSDNIGELNFRTNSGVFLGRVDGRNDGLGVWSSSGLPINFKPGNTGTKVTFQNNGNVGIGTTSPSTKLHVFGNDANLRLTESDWKNGSGQQGGPYLEFALGGNTSEQSFVHARIRSIDRYTAGGAFHGALSFLTSSAGSLGERMRIEYNGNIGVGTTTPSAKLDVVGDVKITGSHTVTTTANSFAGDPTGVRIEVINVEDNFGAFLDYVIHDGGRDSQRAGTLTVTWNLAEIRFNETATMDIGDTSGATLTAVHTGANAEIYFASPDPTWEIKYTLRKL